MAGLELWQLASMDDVAKVPKLVLLGARTGRAVAAHFGRTPRQGSYMLHAAQLLSLVRWTQGGAPAVTPLGQSLISASGNRRALVMRRAVATSAPGRAMLLALRHRPMTLDDAVQAIRKLRPSSPAEATLRRRVGELLKWLARLGLAKQTGAHYQLSQAGQQVRRLASSRKPSVGQGKITRAPGRVIDVERRRTIERIAVKAVSCFYADQGFDVITRELENLGWDLDVTHRLLGMALFVEVKGTSRSQFTVELSPNEYTHMRRHRLKYRVCVVTNALGRPSVNEFMYEPGSRKWISSRTGKALRILRLTSARLSSA